MKKINPHKKITAIAHKWQHLMLVAGVFMFAGTVYAACTSPAGVEGQVTYNSTHKVMQFCDGTDWYSMGCSGGGSTSVSLSACTDGEELIYNATAERFECPSDAAPDAFAFTDQTGVALSTVIESNIVQIANMDDGTAISISGTGTPAYRICADATCSAAPSYTTSAGTINSGQYVQLRLTSSASYGTMNSATVTIGSGSDQWGVTSIIACAQDGEKSQTLPTGCAYVNNTCYVYSDIASTVAISSNFITTPSSSDHGDFKWRLNGCDNRGSGACGNIDYTPYTGWGNNAISSFNGSSCTYTTPAADAVPNWGYTQTCPGPDAMQVTGTRKCYRLLETL